MVNTMFSFCLCISAVAILLQGAEGGWLEEHLEAYSSSVTQPVYDATQKLESILADLEVKKQELELHKKQIQVKLAQIPKECQNEKLHYHISFFHKWDLDSCVDLTDDWKVGADLAMKGTVFALNLTKEVGSIGNNILNCPSLPILKVLPCYNSNLIDLKHQIDGFRGQTGAFVENALHVANSMREHYEKCVGLPSTLKDHIEKHMKKIRC